MNDRLLTTRQVAEMLGLSPETVLRWWRSGRLPGGRRLNGSNCLRFRQSLVEAWLEGDVTAGDATEEVSPAPNVTRQLGVSSFPSPVPPLTAATTEEN